NDDIASKTVITAYKIYENEINKFLKEVLIFTFSESTLQVKCVRGFRSLHFLMTLSFGFKFLKKIKNMLSLYYIYLIYFNLLFFCVGKKSVFKGGYRIIAYEETVYSV